MALPAIAFALMGLILIFNVGSSADSLAGMNRVVPWWLKSPGGNDAATWRVAGGIFVVAAAAFAYEAMAAATR